MAGGLSGSSNTLPNEATRFCTMLISSSKLSGTGKITVLKRRLSAEDNSLTPLSRLLAVAITLKPLIA